MNILIVEAVLLLEQRHEQLEEELGCLDRQLDAGGITKRAHDTMYSFYQDELHDVRRALAYLSPVWQ